MRFDLINYYTTIIAILIGMVIVGSIFYLIFFLRKRGYLDKKEASILIVIFTLLIFLFSFPEEILYDYIIIPNISRGVNLGLVNIGKSALMISISFFILYKFSKHFQNYPIKTTFEAEKIANSILKDISNKNKLFTLFNTTLPKGAKDEDLGIDYVPFMLNKLEINKREFKKDAKRFLTWSIAVGTIFILSIFFFAYIIITNSSLSFASSLKNLREENQKVLTLLADENNPNNVGFDKVTKTAIQQIQQTLIDKLDTTNINSRKILSAINKYNIDKNLIQLNNSLQENTNYLYGLKLTNEAEKINNSLTSWSTSKIQLSSYVANINSLINKAEIEIEKPQNQTNEIIKRLSIGLIVTSFLFAILRFLIKQYHSNIENTIRCEKEDLLIRKLYIGLKISTPNNDERKIIIQKLVETAHQEKADNQSLSSDEAGIIKEILAAVSKKL